MIFDPIAACIVISNICLLKTRTHLAVEYLKKKKKKIQNTNNNA